MIQEATPQSIWTFVQTGLKGVTPPGEASKKLNAFLDNPGNMTVFDLITEVFDNTCWINHDAKEGRAKRAAIAYQSRMWIQNILRQEALS